MVLAYAKSRFDCATSVLDSSFHRLGQRRRQDQRGSDAPRAALTTCWNWGCQQGTLDEIDTAVLEVNGGISIIPKEQ